MTGGVLDESNWRDWWSSTCVLAWACGSPSCNWDTEGAKAVSLRWIDTNKGEAGRPNDKSRLVVREKAMKKSDVPSATELFSGMPPLESVKHCSVWSSLTVKKRRRASELRQCTTSVVRTSTEYVCKDCSWNSLTRRENDLRVRGCDKSEADGLLEK